MKCSVRIVTFSAIVGLIAAVNVDAASLGPRSSGLLKKSITEGSATVTLLIAAKNGKNAAVAQRVQDLGGVVKIREDDVDYLRVTIAPNKVKTLAAFPDVQAVEMDQLLAIPDPRPAGTVPPTPQTPPNAATPRSNPYLPIQDTKADVFTAAHPTWDGRDVTIAIVDTGVSLDHPSLLTTSTGERKVIDWVTYTDPFDDDDPTWIDMQTQVKGATFIVNAVTYTAPYAGTFRFGVFNERDPRLGGELGNDVNRDGNPPGSSGLFAVLWDTGKHVVWVDTNQNASFADELPMRDYKDAYDVGVFGIDNPATPIREAVPFVVQTDDKNKVVNIGIVSGAHGSHVAGIVSGSMLFGGAMSGAAPGAKIVSIRACLFIAGCTAHALVEGMIYAAKKAKVDIINLSMGGLPALNDGNNTRAALYNRLIEKYDVQIFLAAGNDGPGYNTIGDPGVATLAMTVGGYVSKDSLQKNYGSDSAHIDNLHDFTSLGPREDGGFKPNIVAPGSAISTTPLWQPGAPVAGTYTLPPGYSMMNGTSMASAQAAGAAALLISAAKQTHVQNKPEQLRQAINSSTRLLDTPRMPVNAQGNGLMDVVAAWSLLSTKIEVAEISATVPVNTVLSGFLATPGVGTGIYDRENVVLGQPYTRTYTITRTKGGSKNATYNVSWVGNDGTFSSAATVNLPMNKPVSFPVTINPTLVGAHAAIMNLDDPSNSGIEYQTMNVVIVADQFTAANNYSVTHSGSVGRAQQLHFFYDVPAATPALKVDFSGPSATPGTGQARFLRFHPYGVGIDSNASTSCYSPSAGSCAGGSPLSRTTTNPLEGVWELTVDARRTSDTSDTPFTLTASILGALVSPNPDTIASATVGVPIARSYTLTNLFGTFTGRAVGTTLGSAAIGMPSIANQAQNMTNVTVTSGSTSLRATIGSPSDPAADLDLYVFNCTTGTCVLAGQSADGDSEESVTIANPDAGTWAVLVDGAAVPAGTTTYRYIDVFVNSAFGSVSVTDANALRPSGSSWTVPASVTANAAPATGRVLFGNVQVRTDTNILVGSGDVIVQSVTP